VQEFRHSGHTSQADQLTTLNAIGLVRDIQGKLQFGDGVLLYS
jgi:hypothetical protein